MEDGKGRLVGLGQRIGGKRAPGRVFQGDTFAFQRTVRNARELICAANVRFRRQDIII